MIARPSIPRPGRAPLRRASQVNPDSLGDGDAIGAWLARVATLVGGPARRRDEIHDELESHLRERARDLMVSGLDEAQAVSRAIGELGDAAELASRYRNLSSGRRRLAMNVLFLGVTAAAVAGGVALWSPRAACPPETQPAPVGDIPLAYQIRLDRAALQPQIRLEPSVFRPLMLELALQRAMIGEISAQDTPLEGVLGMVAEASGARLFVRWGSLDRAGVERNTPINVSVPAGDISAAFEAINEAIDPAREPGQRAIEYRLADGVLEVATTEYFDRRDAQLVRYEIGDLLDQGVEAESIIGLLADFVEPERWTQNGGIAASQRIVGRSMFVKAPARMHTGVEWMLKELRAGEGLAAPQREGAADPVADPNAALETLRRFIIQHVAADDALNDLKGLQSIREVDFNGFVSDPRTNSIIGKARPAYLDLVARALRDIDVERNDKGRSHFER